MQGVQTEGVKSRWHGRMWPCARGGGKFQEDTLEPDGDFAVYMMRGEGDEVGQPGEVEGPSKQERGRRP